jgi:surface polysaccharide O-acyltransferase-like enzyme
MIIGLLVLFRRRFNTQGRVRKFLSANAYAVYIIHPIIVVGVGFGLHTVALYPLLKFGIAAIIAIPACFGFAALIRAVPLARKIL